MPSKQRPITRLRTPLSEQDAHEVVRAVKRSDVTTASERLGVGVIERPGHVLAGGGRRGARTLRRMTVYLPLDLAEALDDLAHARRESKSEILAAAFRALIAP